MLEPTNIPGDVVTMNFIVQVRKIPARNGHFSWHSLERQVRKVELFRSCRPWVSLFLATGREMSWNGTCPREMYKEIIYQPERLGNYNL